MTEFQKRIINLISKEAVDGDYYPELGFDKIEEDCFIDRSPPLFEEVIEVDTTQFIPESPTDAYQNDAMPSTLNSKTPKVLQKTKKRQTRDKLFADDVIDYDDFTHNEKKRAGARGISKLEER
ncbi:uncharacterized protein LOC118752279 [Rhagoletis pomonella]|uniref:uncharacterized protein LOC118752279 n=1 Tax=Rhagoletis pomonella TaxID=28610 RepID=UPI001780FE96|nr:uncharacterized protein LOC118752279 [Rhagoletis pomonella]